MSRPSRDNTYIRIANIIAERGTCLRGQNGCVITKQNRIIATGYNGRLIGACSERNCDLEKGCVHAVHAEENAIAFAAGNGIALFGSTLYCTSCPCYKCASLIAQSGIAKVVYQMEYRNNDGKDLLLATDIEVVKYEE